MPLISHDVDSAPFRVFAPGRLHRCRSRRRRFDHDSRDALGFYDGFFGPGTGSFLIFLFVGVFGFDFLSASASAKVINLATNIASVVYFGWTGNIIYQYAVPMALCGVLGAAIGTRLAIAKGSRFVRIFFLIIVGALIAKLAQSIIAP